MPLTEKGIFALQKIKEYYPSGIFSAKELSDACGEKIYAATLNGIANNGYLIKFEGSPVTYQIIDNINSIDLNLSSSKKGSTNANLRKAAKVKDDEFYTRYQDIEEEAMRYRKYFKNKIIYLPCDDPAEKKSEFWSFFLNNFDAFGLKKLIATHYDENGRAYKIWVEEDINGDGYIDDDDVLQEDLEGNGDFRSQECVDILKSSDIIITNPPFSLFRELVDLILSNNKQFLIIGNKNAYGYKEIFSLIKENKIWAGIGRPNNFILPDGSTTKKANGLSRWFTNLPNNKRTEKMILTKTYSPIIYPNYDNYNAINVDKVKDIPKDYDGYMGVPITFIDSYNPEQFQIFGIMNTGEKNEGIRYENTPHGRPLVNGEEIYIRMIIKRIS